MIDTLNTIATVIGYGAIICGIGWLLDQRRKEKSREFVREIDRGNEASMARLKETDPQGWADAMRLREGIVARNEHRRSEIARLQAEMELEFWHHG